MRRFAILLVAPLLLLPGRHAHSQVALTVAVGANVATLAYAERSERHQPWSFHGGTLAAAVGLPVSDDWGIQLGLGLSTKGYSEKNDCRPDAGSGVCSPGGGIYLFYLESSLLADRRIELGNRFLLHLLAGPSLGYQLDPNFVRSRVFDYAVAGGIQLDTRLSDRMALSAGTLYTHGFSNIHDNSHVIEAWRDWYVEKTRTLTLRTGFSYSIG